MNSNHHRFTELFLQLGTHTLKRRAMEHQPRKKQLKISLRLSRLKTQRSLQSQTLPMIALNTTIPAMGSNLSTPLVLINNGSSGPLFLKYLK